MKSKDKINKVNVRIFDDEYVIKGSADTYHIEKVASLVDQKMRQLCQKNPYLSPKKVAVLTALNIADELYRLRDDYDALIKLLDETKQS